MRKVHMVMCHGLLHIQIYVSIGIGSHACRKAWVLRAKRGKMDMHPLSVKPSRKEPTAHNGMQVANIAAVDHDGEMLPRFSMDSPVYPLVQNKGVRNSLFGTDSDRLDDSI